MAADLDELAPLYPNETEAVIRARWDAWANEGITEEQTEEWTDTREGSIFQFTTQGGVRESARVYDLMGTEVIRAASPLYAWGPYLDGHAQVQDILRTAAKAATGEVTFTGLEGAVIQTGTRVGVEPPSPDAPAPEYLTTAGGAIPAGGTLTLPVEAVEAGVAGNVSANAVSLVLTPGLGVDVANAEEVRGGTERETDLSLRTRLLESYRGQGPGNARDYVSWARAYLGGGRVTVIPLHNGPGTVLVIAIDANGDPLQPAQIAGLQAFLAPLAGMGGGEAPVGVTVTVETAAPFAVALAALIEFEAGFSLDGSASTVALREVILTRVREYVESVEPGGEIVLAQVIGRIVSVAGVHDATGVTLNGTAGNLPVEDSPAQLPFLDDEAAALVEA